MFANFEIGKTASVLICTVLFSATCVLSAVGPARADDSAARGVSVVAPLA